MSAPVSSQAEKFAADFCGHWQERLLFVFPLEMVEDLAVRYDGRSYRFDGSTGTPLNGQAGYVSPPVPGTNNG